MAVLGTENRDDFGLGAKVASSSSLERVVTFGSETRRVDVGREVAHGRLDSRIKGTLSIDLEGVKLSEVPARMRNPGGLTRKAKCPP